MITFNQKIESALLAAIVLLSFFLVTPKVQAKELIHAAIYDFFPIGFRDKNDNINGVSVDIIRAISNQAEYKLQIHYLPVPRALKAVSQGDVDLLYSYKDSVMLPGVDFLGKVGCLTSLIVPRLGIKINTLEDLDGLRVGFVTGGYFSIRFAPHYKMTPFPLPSNETMFRMLVRERLDAIVLNDAVLLAYRQRDFSEARLASNWQNAIGKPFILETLETHISLSHASKFQPEKKKIADAIRSINVEGVVERIYKKYGMPHGGSCNLAEIQHAIN